MKNKLFIILGLFCACSAPAFAAGPPVDPALVGTWKLQWPRADYFWAVRDDGVYRMHGPGGTSQQGRVQASGGRFSLKSPLWVDEGPYSLEDAETWVVTGNLGPGTWKRVWTPPARQSETPAGKGVCGLLTAGEAARALRAPATIEPDPHDANRCTWQSALGQFDEIKISVIPSRRESWFNTRKNPNPQHVAVPGLAEDAYAEGGRGGGALKLNILKGPLEASVDLRLTPSATMEDLPYLIEVGKAVGPRMGSGLPDWRELIPKPLRNDE